jgi:LPS O-antigen subunit length determinant protein (WzzB/FepE family)
VNENQANTELLKNLFLNRKKILFISIVFGLIAIGLTFFIPKKYTALGIVYPTASNSIKDVVTHPGFGYDIQSDRLIQLFQSQIMQDWVIQKFDLISYYEIDPNKTDWVHSLKKKYSNDVSFSRNKYLSVEIEVSSKDPNRSADMVNEMIHYMDTIKRDIFITNTQLLVSNLKKQTIGQEEKVNHLLFQIFNSQPSSQKNTLSENTQVIIQERKNKAIQQLGDEAILNALKNNYSLNMEKLINQYYHELGILNTLKKDLVIANEQIALPFPGIYHITNAVANGKKTSPSVIRNGLIGWVTGFIFSIVFYILQVKIRSIYTMMKED